MKGQEDESDAFSGSAAYLEVCRSALVAMPDPASRERDLRRRPRVLAAAKGNLGPDGVHLPYRIEDATAGDVATAQVVWK